MRRRSSDVFEFGDEQLLDEPAVELSDAEDPLTIPLAGCGSADEEKGPAGGAGGDARTQPCRPPILDVIRGRLRLGAGIAIAAVASAAALLLAQLPSGSDPERDPGAASGGERTLARINGSSRSRTEASRSKSAPRRQRSLHPKPAPEPALVEREPRPVGPAVAFEGEDPLGAEAPTPMAASAPSDLRSDSGVDPELHSGMSRGEILAREFGP